MKGLRHDSGPARGSAEGALLRMPEPDRAAVAEALRSETAQALATVLVGLAALEACGDLEVVQGALREFREVVRAELERIQSLAARIQGNPGMLLLQPRRQRP